MILIRHGRPIGGVKDPGLSDLGRTQAEVVADRLASESITVIVASSLQRAAETAVPLATRLGLPVECVPDLREWEPYTPRPAYVVLEDLDDDHPQKLALAEGRYEAFVPPLDHDALRGRARSVVADLFERHPGERIAAFAHGGIINAVLAEILGISDRLYFHDPAYTAFARVARLPGGRVIVRSMGETGHVT